MDLMIMNDCLHISTIKTFTLDMSSLFKALFKVTYCHGLQVRKLLHHAIHYNWQHCHHSGPTLNSHPIDSKDEGPCRTWCCVGTQISLGGRNFLFSSSFAYSSNLMAPSALFTNLQSLSIFALFLSSLCTPVHLPRMVPLSEFADSDPISSFTVKESQFHALLQLGS
jgi:hypothetical protein